MTKEVKQTRRRVLVKIELKYHYVNRTSRKCVNHKNLPLNWEALGKLQYFGIRNNEMSKITNWWRWNTASATVLLTQQIATWSLNFSNYFFRSFVLVLGRSWPKQGCDVSHILLKFIKTQYESETQRQEGNTTNNLRTKAWFLSENILDHKNTNNKNNRLQKI